MYEKYICIYLLYNFHRVYWFLEIKVDYLSLNMFFHVWVCKKKRRAHKNTLDQLSRHGWLPEAFSESPAFLSGKPCLSVCLLFQLSWLRRSAGNRKSKSKSSSNRWEIKTTIKEFQIWIVFPFNYFPPTRGADSHCEHTPLNAEWFNTKNWMFLLLITEFLYGNNCTLFIAACIFKLVPERTECPTLAIRGAFVK